MPTLPPGPSPTTAAPLRLNIWSGPRNISTALMYSFAQRSDTRVVDEPLYGHYLRVSGARHPGREEVLQAMETDGDTVVRDVILGSTERPVLMLKQMAHHLTDLDPGFLTQTTNVLLVREPSEMLRSLVHQIPDPGLRDTGLGVQRDLLRQLRSMGQTPPVLEARQILLNPRGVLAELCSRLGIPFDEAMLSWPAGPRPEDGVWAPHWYANVHRSTGFQPYRPKEGSFPERLRSLLEECQACYEELAPLAIRPRKGESHAG